MGIERELFADIMSAHDVDADVEIDKATHSRAGVREGGRADLHRGDDLEGKMLDSTTRYTILRSPLRSHGRRTHVTRYPATRPAARVRYGPER
jgi:hypothetical protein